MQVLNAKLVPNLPAVRRHSRQEEAMPPIFVPGYTTRPLTKPSRSPFFGVYYTLHEVIGRRATLAELTHALAKLRRSDVIRWLASISAWISDEGGMDLGNQLTMADVLLADD